MGNTISSIKSVVVTIPYFLDELWKYVCRKIRKMVVPQDPLLIEREQPEMWRRFLQEQRIDEYYRKQGERWNY